MKTYRSNEYVPGYLVSEVEIPNALAKVIKKAEDQNLIDSFKVPMGWEVTVEEGDVNNPSVIKHVQYYANCQDDCRHILSGHSPVCCGCCWWHELNFNLPSNYWRE